MNKALEKFFKSHHSGCAIFRFSDGYRRHCSCGRDEAWLEVQRMIALAQKMEDKQIELPLELHERSLV